MAEAGEKFQVSEAEEPVEFTLLSRDKKFITAAWLKVTCSP